MTIEPVGPGSAPVLDREPVAVFVGGLVGVIDGGLVAGEALGWLSLTPDQTAALVAFISLVAGLVIPPLRSFVTCRATARRAGIGTP